MKRYDLVEDNSTVIQDKYMSEHPLGEWVKWDDVLDLLSLERQNPLLESTIAEKLANAKS